MTDIDGLSKILQEDPNIFLLNNILMSVQFFENYDRDIKLLREDWFKEFSLDSHHKKCFHADSLFRLSASKVKFSATNGINKNLDAPLHPFRIYITSDNVEAAYDPSALGRNSLNTCPQYQFTVKCNEKNEKQGSVYLVEFQKKETPSKSIRPRVPRNRFSFKETAISSKQTEEQNSNIYLQRKPPFEERQFLQIKRLSKTDNSVGYQNNHLNLKMMNSSPTAPHEIPPQCFQIYEVKSKLNSRRRGIYKCSKTRKVLNSAAFKEYFCEMLIERLSEPLSLDFNALNESSFLEEFIVVNQKGVQYWIAPIITIGDWNNFVEINKKFPNPGKTTKLEWPSNSMQKIMNILPCNATPTGQMNPLEENQDYEKIWKLVFPKAEEFLLLHMMHAHIRCYFFVLLIYKSFIEKEINIASFGPKHLLHLLLWRVHKNFLAWPEDRLGETLLNYLKTLYKKIQNKSLSDFFINSRNLFAGSLSKDLHKAQVLIKKILENPVPYVIMAIRNLKFESNFYPTLDIVNLNSVLFSANVNEGSKNNRKKRKMVSFQNDEKQYWKKYLIKPTGFEQKVEKQQQICNSTVESINITEIWNFNSEDLEKCNKVLKIFSTHFVEMASKSIEFKYFSQALFYLHKTEKLFEVIISKGENHDNFKSAIEKINNLKETCYNKLKLSFKKSFPIEQHRLPMKKADENFKVVQNNSELKQESKEASMKQDIKENYNVDENIIDENEFFSIKL